MKKNYWIVIVLWIIVFSNTIIAQQIPATIEEKIVVVTPQPYPERSTHFIVMVNINNHGCAIDKKSVEFQFTEIRNGKKIESSRQKANDCRYVAAKNFYTFSCYWEPTPGIIYEIAVYKNGDEHPTDVLQKKIEKDY